MNFRKSKPYEAALGTQNGSLLSLKPFLFVCSKALVSPRMSHMLLRVGGMQLQTALAQRG